VTARPNRVQGGGRRGKKKNKVGSHRKKQQKQIKMTSYSRKGKQGGLPKTPSIQRLIVAYADVQSFILVLDFFLKA